MPGAAKSMPVSLPSVATHCPAATAAADPPEEPPGTHLGSQGFRVTCAQACMSQAYASCQGYASLQNLRSSAAAWLLPQPNTEATAAHLKRKGVTDAMLASEEGARACRRWHTSHRQRGRGVPRCAPGTQWPWWGTPRRQNMTHVPGRYQSACECMHVPSRNEDKDANRELNARLVVTGLGGGAHGEGVAVALAQHQRARRAQARDRGRVVRRHIPPQRRRACRGHQARCAQRVLRGGYVLSTSRSCEQMAAPAGVARLAAHSASCATRFNDLKDLQVPCSKSVSAWLILFG